ncbi:MAG TPA: hypothetical protein P5058_03740 [Eubacteriales bacterium]|nr:hypothetical protein [Eubacteriales bacterium]
MCDTFYKRGDRTVIFGKNSDRGCNEPNLTVVSPVRRGGGDLKCTYITIPDAPSQRTILVKPSWTWGAEMGVNEAGVAIGNEAVFSKKKSKTPSLIGMDYVRLALERGKCARDAADIIISLLKEYGQGGNCGFDHNFYYDNSYLIADRVEAYILETAGCDYALKKLENEGNISNRLSIETDYDECSLKEGTNFKKSFSDKIFTTFSASGNRECTGAFALKNQKSTVYNMMNTLRIHLPVDEEKLYLKGSVGSVCMHQSLLGDHTTGSMMVDLSVDYPTVWVTGASTPCQSVFKPVYFDCPCPPLFTNEKQSLGYWLEREYINRALFSGYIDRAKFMEKARALENSFIAEESSIRKSGGDKRALHDLAEKASLLEQALIDSYYEIGDKIKSGAELCGVWAKKTEKLRRLISAPDKFFKPFTER